jgi:hypothetical protein
VIYGIAGHCLIVDNRGNRGAGTGETFDDCHIADKASGGPANVCWQVQTQEVVIGKLLDHRLGKLSRLVQFPHNRVKIFLGKVVSALLDESLIFGQFEVHCLPAFCAMATAGAGASTARDMTRR